MAPKHPFAGKSPAQRAADIRPAESWPATAVGWSEASGKLQLTVTHHESAAPVEAFHPSDNMLGALCLFWAVAVEALPPLDIGTLQQRDANFHWSTYQAAMCDLVAYLAAAPPDAPHQLQQAAAAHVGPFTDALRAASPDQFLMLLAADELPKRPIDRVPLVHWLLTWHAAHHKKPLRCQITPQGDTRLPAPCPLSTQQWNAEITRHKSTLTYPGILSRVAIKRAELAGTSASSEPLWKRMLTQPGTLAASSDFTIDIERLATTPDSHAEHVAQSIRVMCTDMSIPESAMTTLRSVKNGRSLASAVKTVWYASPANLRPSLQANLLDLISTVEDLHGSSALESHKLAALKTLDPLVDAAAARHDLVWSSAAATLLAARPTVIPLQATDLLLAVRDPVTFRVAVSAAVQGTTRTQGLDQLIAEVRTALQPAAGPAAAYAWFERRTSGPPPHMPPPGPLPTPPTNSWPQPTCPLPYPSSPLAPAASPTGLLPPAPIDAPQVIRLRGLRTVPDATQASTALTHHVGAPIAIPAHALHEGTHFVSVPSSPFRALFASAPTRTYVDPHHQYTITLDSRTANGEPFFLPDSPVKPPPKKRLKAPKNRRASHRPSEMPPPAHPPPGFTTSSSASRAPSASTQAPRAYETVPHTRDAPHTAHRVTPYQGSRVN